MRLFPYLLIENWIVMVTLYKRRFSSRIVHRKFKRKQYGDGVGINNMKTKTISFSF